MKTTFRETNGLYTIDELCAYFEVSRSYIKTWISRGVFDAFRVRMGARWLYRVEPIEEFFLNKK